jgi:RNA polymerase sigma-70 factor (ECF subfamily)
MSILSAPVCVPEPVKPLTVLLPRLRSGRPASLLYPQLADDLALAEGCRAQQPAALRQLVEQYQSDVYGLCVRFLDDRHEAEDVAQEVFLRVFRSLGSWDRQRPLRPWIIGIAVNRCRTFLARRARRPKVCENLHEHVARDSSANALDELQREIQLALSELRVAYREVFVLFHEQGMPYDLIAQAMDRPVGTIKTWLHRARLEVLARLRARGMVSEVDDELS